MFAISSKPATILVLNYTIFVMTVKQSYFLPTPQKAAAHTPLESGYVLPHQWRLMLECDGRLLTSYLPG